MSRLRLSDQLKALQQQHLDLRRQVVQLRQSHRHLLLRQALLHTWCGSMALLLELVSQQPDYTLEGSLEQLMGQEVDLLQQLSTPEQASQQPTLSALMEPEMQTISPCVDPMAYLQRVVSQAPLQEAFSMTEQDFAACIKGMVLSVSLKSHAVQGAALWDRPHMLQEIAGVWDRYMHMIVSCIMLGRQGVVEKAHAINLETMQPEPAAAANHQAAQAAMLVPLLGLSEQQQEFIAVGMRLHADLLLGIHSERQKLQLQLASNSSDEGSSDSHGSSSGSVSSISSGQLDSLSLRHQELQQQQAQTDRLNLLLHKGYMLRMAAMGWFVGCLTYAQLSRLAVLSWPYPMRVLFLGNEIMQQREKLLQQRLQLMT